MSCTFCNIINKDINANIIFENDKAMALLPKEMEVYGHILVIPKKHYFNIFDIPKNELYEVMSVVQDISIKIKDVLGATGVNILNANGEDAQQSINHLHFHILPRFEYDNINAWPNLPCPNINVDELMIKLNK